MKEFKENEKKNLLPSVVVFCVVVHCGGCRAAALLLLIQ